MEIVIKDNLESFTLNYSLQMQRRNSDLIETGLRKRTLTHTSSVNLPRTLSTSNLSRSISGSVTNLSKTSPRMVRSCSSSSFSAVELGARSGRQDPLVKSQVSILCWIENKMRKPRSSIHSFWSDWIIEVELRLDVLLPRIWGGLSVIHVSINIVQLSQMDINKAKSSLKMNLGLGSNQKSDGLNQVERLRRELQEAHNLVCSLRAQVDQKEHIAALALSGSRVSSHESHDLQKIVCNP